MEDNEIVSRYISGQSEVMDILVDRYKIPLYRLCYHLTANNMDADDLFQETWIKAVKSIKLYDTGKPLLPWLCTICTNLYKDRYRVKKRWINRIKEYFSSQEKDAEMDSVHNSAPMLEDELVEKFDREAVRKYINMLDDTYRLPIILYYFKEVDYSDIGEILGIPIGTVKSRLYTAKQKLRKLMEVEQYEE